MGQAVEVFEEFVLVRHDCADSLLTSMPATRRRVFPTAMAGEKDNTVLYHLRTGKKKKFRRMSGSGKVLDGCRDEMRSVSAG